MAGTILRFRTRGTASKDPIDPRQAHRACLVLRLPEGRRDERTVANATARAGISLLHDVDSPFVAQLRESVARGEYRVDAKRVALKLIAAHGL